MPFLSGSYRHWQDKKIIIMKMKHLLENAEWCSLVQNFLEIQTILYWISKSFNFLDTPENYFYKLIFYCFLLFHFMWHYNTQRGYRQTMEKFLLWMKEDYYKVNEGLFFLYLQHFTVSIFLLSLYKHFIVVFRWKP